MKQLPAVLLATFFLSAAVLNGQEQTRREHPASAESNETPGATAHSANEPAKPTEPVDEKPVVTHHKIVVRGKTLSYTATTGFLPIKDDQGRAEARMFYVAYTLDASGPKRPLTFAFNGGPGSATIWLHMGCFGPKRVKMRPNGFMPPPPFEWEDNQNTILDKSDIVFVDAIGTGYSRANTPELGKKFWSVSGDIAAFGEFIRLFLQKNTRWTSPVFLAGESYGTTRAAGLSGYLVDHGIALNGIILISTILNFETVSFGIGNDLPYILFLPTYAATAAFHQKLGPELQRDPEALRLEAEKWAAGEYTLALQQGDAIEAGTRQSVIDHLARYTGLSKQYIARCNLRVDLSHFDTELLRDETKIVGRLDGRFTAFNETATQQTPEFDPSEAAIRPPYTAVFGDYVKQELGFQSDSVYYVLGGGIGHWDFDTSRSGFADTSQALRRAFAKNPFLQVYIAEGVYDAATPYFAVEYTFNHMGLTPEAHKNVTRGRYNAGHMIYIDNESMMKLKQDVDALFDRSLAR